MAVTVHMNDGVTLRVKGDLDEISKAYEVALGGSSLLDIRSGDGTLRRVNAHQILYFEEDEDEQDREEVHAATPRREAAGSR
jgi:hypothetical protein